MAEGAGRKKKVAAMRWRPPKALECHRAAVAASAASAVQVTVPEAAAEAVPEASAAAVA